VTQDDSFLTVVNAKDDQRTRTRAVVVIGACIAGAMILVRQPMLFGLPGYLWSTSLLLGGVVFAYQSGLFVRTHTLLRLASIRRDGLLATQKLNVGDFAGAREAFALLLVSARSLGAFHAVHVLMFGVTRFFEGETKEGLTLVSRAIASGWLDLRHTRAVREAAETWRVMMLLDVGEVEEARRRSENPRDSLITGAMAVEATAGNWDAVLAYAEKALANPEFPKAGRPTVAGLARFAAKQKGVSAKDYERILKDEPLGVLALKNPTLRRFLG
jgi:hypothetical protein